MNSSKILFVGRYAKSPKKSPKKTARSSKSKYEDISLGTVMRTSKSRNTTVDSNINVKRNTNRSSYQKRSPLETIRKINLNDKASITSKSTSVNRSYTSNNTQKTTNNYKNIGNSVQKDSKNSIINVKKIMEKQSISVPKRANIVSNSRLLDKRLPDNTVADIGNIKPKTRKSKSSNKTKNPVQKTDRVRKSKTNKISSKSRIKKQVSPKNVSINLLNPTKKVDVYVNPDLYLKINSLFYPHLFVKSSHNFKFFSNFDLHDKYLASVISHGLMIRKYS